MLKYIILLATVVSFLLFVISGCQPAPAEPIRDVEEPLVEDIGEVETHGVGETVTVGDIVWEVTEVEDLGTEIILEDREALQPRVGRFLAVSFFIQNIGEETRTIFDLTLIDDQGRTYQICLESIAFFEPEEACVLQEIIPEVENNYAASFDVEIDAEGLILQVTDLRIPAQEVAYIELGI